MIFELNPLKITNYDMHASEIQANAAAAGNTSLFNEFAFNSI